MSMPTPLDRVEYIARNSTQKYTSMLSSDVKHLCRILLAVDRVLSSKKLPDNGFYVIYERGALEELEKSLEDFKNV